MSKPYVFRLNTTFPNGQATLPLEIKDWNETKKGGYDATEIAQISSSNPNSTNEPTSVPSPFARMLLTKTAFEKVAQKGVKALMVYQQIVSNSLDVAEIFFKFDTLKDHAGLEIIKWSFSDLKSINSSILKSTFELFFQGDAKALNFRNELTFYFLRHINTGKIIGGTSPRTLFFSATNVKRRKGGVVEPEFIYPDGTFFVRNENIEGEPETTYDKIELSHGHYAFSDIIPLSGRDIEFQDYLHTWVKINNNVIYGGAFDELKAYLDSQIPPAETAHFNNLPENLNAYIPLKFYDVDQKEIDPEVLGRELSRQKVNPIAIKDTSDFIVNSAVFEGENPPMILGGAAPGIENWKLYGDTKWKTHTVNSVQDRNILPGGTPYAWLTVEDFLENKIIQLPKLAENKYFSGNHTSNEKKSVLLPLKDKLFEFFTVKELESMLKIDGSSNIKVMLKIPLKNGKTTTFSKEYKSADIITLSVETNFMLFPNVKFIDSQSAFYRFGLFRAFNEVKKLSAKFFNKSNEVVLNDINDVITRNTNDYQNNICTTYAIEQKEIDRVKILIDDNVSGLIIPKLNPVGSNIDFTFAVDLGTTNTHIEYKAGEGSDIKPFDITEEDEQISWFVNAGERVSQTRLVADIDFIPERIGCENTTNIKVKFPTRTALIVANNTTTDLKLPFSHTNIILPFDKRNVPAYNGVPITQLKWESDIEEVGLYINNLCYLIRNKVVLNNGNLANTKICWTYPLSMNLTRLEQVAEKWNVAYRKYFNENEKNATANCTNLAESLAPFYHYRNLPDVKKQINDLVSIDIGGGTTDVVFVKGNEPKHVTSFRFAANDLLGLGENVSKIITKHKDDIITKISITDKDSDSRMLLKTMESIGQNRDFGDYASFFFSLKDNEDLTEGGTNIDFNKTLREDNNQKLVFLLFFAAIIYHTAQVMHAKGLPMPRHLTLSGNGSRIIDVLGREEMVEKIVTLIFEKIFGAEYGKEGMQSKLEIIQNTSNPKEVTCKGAILTLDEKLASPSYDVLLGIDSTSFAERLTYLDLQKDTDLIEKINSQVNLFFTYVFEVLLNSEIKKQIGRESIKKALSIPEPAIIIAKAIIADKEDIKNITKNRLKDKIRQDESAEIEETFFFFPIPTLLRTISREIEKKEY